MIMYKTNSPAVNSIVKLKIVAIDTSIFFMRLCKLLVRNISESRSLFHRKFNPDQVFNVSDLTEPTGKTAKRRLNVIFSVLTGTFELNWLSNWCQLRFVLKYCVSNWAVSAERWAVWFAFQKVWFVSCDFCERSWIFWRVLNLDIGGPSRQLSSKKCDFRSLYSRSRS